jgi:hypothetical protein
MMRILGYYFRHNVRYSAGIIFSFQWPKIIQCPIRRVEEVVNADEVVGFI